VGKRVGEALGCEVVGFRVGLPIGAAVGKLTDAVRKNLVKFNAPNPESGSLEEEIISKKTNRKTICYHPAVA
jgi:hypothetical protein